MTTAVRTSPAPATSRVAQRLRHYVSVKDLNAQETLDLLELARGLKRDQQHGHARPLLHRRTLAMIFQKPSLRTRVSFEAGMTQLGGHAIYLGPDDIRLGARETTEDIAIVLSRMSDLVMARVFGHDIVEQLARYATVPVINGLSDHEHPCQILGDLLTILERKHGLAGLRTVFVGDGNNVANSLMLAGAMVGMHVTVAGPAEFAPAPALLAEARATAAATGAVIGATTDLYEACRDADVVYTDVWTSMGQEAEAERRRAVFGPYQVNDSVMALAKPDAVLLHCLPAHYGEELDYATSRRPNSAIFDQAENRLHAQKALMVTLAG
jgi:ornithine carbamoyltransferase